MKQKDFFCDEVRDHFFEATWNGGPLGLPASGGAIKRLQPLGFAFREETPADGSCCGFSHPLLFTAHLRN